MYMLVEDMDKALQTMEIAYLAGYLDKENQFKALAQLYSNNLIPYKAATIMLKHLESGDIEKTMRNYQMVAGNFEQSRDFAKLLRSLKKLHSTRKRVKTKPKCTVVKVVLYYVPSSTRK